MLSNTLLIVFRCNVKEHEMAGRDERGACSPGPLLGHHNHVLAGLSVSSLQQGTAILSERPAGLPRR